jgi:16S rRNA (uracil1498-N3)-methyltransferase
LTAADAASPADLPGPLAFVEDLDDPALDPADRHHLERVVRLRSGDPITVADGAGRFRACRFGPALEAVGDIGLEAAPEPAVTVCFALIKGERPELVVQKLTELGVDRIVPFAAGRSIVRWDAVRAARHVERLGTVARAAAAQSHRARLPEVTPLATFAEVAALPDAARCDRGGVPPGLDRPTLLVGPEGGWTDEEQAVDLPTVGLVDHVLRAETAAIVAGALLCTLRVGMVGERRRRRHAR